MSGVNVLMLKKSSDRKRRETLEAAFKKADKNGDGLLTADEYYTVLKEHGVECTYDEVMNIMAMADKNHDGKISKEEFLGQQDTKPAGSKAEAAFKAFDKNHDGYVTKSEMRKVSKTMTKEQVDAVFQRNDSDNDGKLTLEDFKNFMKN